MVLWIFRFVGNKMVKVGAIDEFISLIWTTRFQETGDFELYLPATQENIKLLHQGYWIARETDININHNMIKSLCRIEKIEIKTDADNGNFLTVTGKDAKSLFQQRYLFASYNLNKSVSDTVYVIISQETGNSMSSPRKLPLTTPIEQIITIPDIINFVSNHENLFDVVKDLGIQYNFGLKIGFDTQLNLFSYVLYFGTNRSMSQTNNPFVVFSPDFENLITSDYINDATESKNSIMVSGEPFDKNEERKSVVPLRFVETPSAKNIERFEYYFDASSDAKRDIVYSEFVRDMYPNGEIVVRDETVYYHDNDSGEDVAVLDHLTEPTTARLLDVAYFPFLDQKGNEQLSQHKNKISFEADVEPMYSFKFNEDYFLGDYVTIKNEYGITATTQIVEVIESYNVEGYKVIPTMQYNEDEETDMNALTTEVPEPMETESTEIILWEA